MADQLNSSQITCPKCGQKIDVQAALASEAQADYEKKLAQGQKEIDARVEKLVAEQGREQRKKIEAQIKEEHSTEVAEMKRELSDKSAKLKEFNATKAEVERLKREKKEAESEAEAKYEAQANQKIMEETAKIAKRAENKHEMEKLELRQKLADQTKLTEEMQRKQKQGSMQLQGEVQEVAIEEWLAEQFPSDTISEVKKGKSGADCLQVVNTQTHQNCGKICYESKRTRNFQPSWIAKFKGDMRAEGADFGVLVTDAMPSDMERMGMREGIWVCSYEEFKALCAVLREAVVRLKVASASQENRGSKKELLYNYVTSREFVMQVEAIVEVQVAMKADLETEKRSVSRTWAKREKQIEKFGDSVTTMFGSIEGIAGNAIGQIKSLQLPEGDPDDD